jgi:hypothetical protein
MKKILLAVLVIALLGGGYAWYLYNKPVADTGDLDAALTVTADQLFSDFESNETDANKKYLGKIIRVNGTVKDVSIGDGGELNLVMNSGNDMFGVNCGLSKGQETAYKDYQVGDSISIKGECTGLSLDVVMTRCVIVN